MASKLYQSERFIWSTKEIIGHGATSSVYRGRSKLTGEAIAVKMFNKAGMDRPQDVQDRELEILQKLKHENIVEMLGIERETSSRGYVVVMEICTGGSLFNVIEKPVYYYGLDEREFLRFLSDTVSGIKYLREHGVVHRDLKPGNILRAVNEDGTHTYKLSDFGAARELRPEEQFMSIYGTEEYLHPGMYEQGVLHIKRRQKFDSTVDLWSIGVTLYHAATGKLPFQAHGGRNNREMMHRIISQKTARTISGIQKTEKESSVEYSDRLPATAQICGALADDIARLLRKILDTNQSEMEGFEVFLDVCEKIASSTCVVVFSMRDSRSFHVHANARESFSGFAALVEKRVGVRVGEQKFHFEGSLLHETRSIGSLPLTTEDNPLLLFDGNNSCVDKKALSHGHIPKVHENHAAADLYQDDKSAKVCLAMCHQYARVAVQMRNCCRGIRASFKALSNALRLDWANMMQKISDINSKCEAIKTKCSCSLDRDQSERHILRSVLTDDTMTQNAKENLNFLDSYFEHHHSEFMAIDSQDLLQETSGTGPDELCTSWEHVCREQMKDFEKWDAIVTHSVKLVGEIWETFHKERKQGRISYLDEHNHVFEKKKLYEVTRKVFGFANNFVSAREVLHEHFAKWLRRFGHQKDSMKQMLRQMADKQSAYQGLEDKLKRWQQSREAKLRLVLNEVPQLSKQKSIAKAKKDSVAEMERVLGRVHRDNEQTLIEVNEQTKALEQFDAIREMKQNLEQVKDFDDSFYCS
eukprot:m.76120 g.76120  ORF g.76120 m.76120 type:complete len:755 (+) comp35969_c0_seq1:593-2857(+)